MNNNGDVDREEIHAPWYEKATIEEKQRLDELWARQERKIETLKENNGEIRKIRRRAIARLRRSRGKQ